MKRCLITDKPQKNLVYYSHDFDGNTHPFQPHSTQIINQSGICRLEPIAFPSLSGDYVNDIDKLLSCARIIYDKEGKIEHTLNNLWKNIAQKFVEHKQKKHQSVDLCSFDLAPLLIRYSRFDSNAKQEIRDKTQDHVQRVLYHSLYQCEESKNTEPKI